MHRGGGHSLTDETYVAALRAAASAEHGGVTTEVIETHISWVVLAGDAAYKVKKPLQLEFLDFSTVDRRRHYCHEEIRLNGPLAPEIYVDVVPIVRRGTKLSFGGDGKTVDYAVRMRRFESQNRLDTQLELGWLDEDDIRELGYTIADMHARAAPAPPERRARFVRTTATLARDNVTALAERHGGRRLDRLSAWTDAQLANEAILFKQRFDAGYVRECHGDLHLANLVRIDGRITPFDGIEFNDDLRIIDVTGDVGFLVMDFVARSHRKFAALCLNHYLEASGDYDGVRLFDFQFVYRCLVRAKVADIGLQQATRRERRDAYRAEVERYMRFALRQIDKPRPQLVVMTGLSGSGKTYIAHRLMADLPAIRLRSDVERKRLHGLTSTDRSDSPLAGGIYSDEAGRATYGRLNDLAEILLASDHNVVLDAAFLSGEQRAAAIAVADRLQCNWHIVQVDAPPDVLEDRIRRRHAEPGEASEADIAVLERQRSIREPLGPAERARTIYCNNRLEPDIASLLTELRSRGAGDPAAR